LDSAVRGSLLHAGGYNVANSCIAPAGTAKHADAKNFFSAGIIGNRQSGFLLDHYLSSSADSLSSVSGSASTCVTRALSLILTSVNLFRLLIGRVSVIVTVSPSLASFFSS